MEVATTSELKEEELRRKIEWLAAILEASREGIVVEKDEHIVYANRAFARLCGCASPEYLVGQHVTIFISDKDHGRMLEFGRKRLQGEQVPSLYEFVGKKMDGSTLDMEASVSTITVDVEKYIVGIIRDLTERKSIEAKLRKLSQAVEESPVSITITDTDGNIEYVNPKFIQTTGYSWEEVRGKNPRILKSGRTSPDVYREMWQTITSGGQWYGDLQNKKKNGDLYWERMSVSPIRDPNGRTTHFIAVKEDITERRQIEEQNRQQAELLNITPDAVMVVDLDDRVIFWNRGADAIYGWKGKEMIGKDCREILAGSSVEKYVKVKCAVLEEGKWTGELNQLRKDGQEIIVESRYVLVRDNEGLPKSILVVGTDLTQKKSLEDQFYHAQRLESLGTLAGGIAHDLNNVLSTVLLSVDLLKNSFPNQDGKRVLETLQTSAERGRDIIKQVLSFSRSVKSEHGEIQLKHIVREIGKIITETFPKSIKLQLSVPKNLWTIHGDATQLHQVLMNLCVNARDAMPQGGIIQISGENTTIDERHARTHVNAKPGQYVFLDVSDTGTGISPDILVKIFEPFFTTKPAGEGTGLGLAAVSSIVKSHAGFIKVYSVVGKGTTFKVYFPAMSTTQKVDAIEQRQPDLPIGNGELVLVVDDEPTVLDVTKQTLESYGYKTLTAKDGTEALAKYAQEKGSIRAVITDVIMPNLDGVGTIRALRKINVDLKIIATSGLTIGEQIDQSIVPEVQAFLQKPYTAEKLLQTLHNVLNEPRKRRSDSRRVQHKRQVHGSVRV